MDGAFFFIVWRLELPRALGNVPVARFNPRRPRAAARVQVSSLAPSSSQAFIACDGFFMLCIKSHLALTPLPKGLASSRSSSPNQTRLRLGFDSVFVASSKLADPAKNNSSSIWMGCYFYLYGDLNPRGLSAKTARNKKLEYPDFPVTPTFDLAFDSAVSLSEAASCSQDLSRASTRCAAAPMSQAAVYRPRRDISASG